MGLIKKEDFEKGNRLEWLEWCERVPPMENHSLHLQARTVRNPYPRMLEFLLNKYPDLRFQDCYVDGNDWSVGSDAYRDDHPAMQFVARQLDLMRTRGFSKKEAFEETEKMFKARREDLEREQKVMMASAYDLDIKPMFTTGQAYLQVEMAKSEAGQLNQIRNRLRMMAAKAQEAAGTENVQGAEIQRSRRMELTEMEVFKTEKKSTDDAEREVPKPDETSLPDDIDDKYDDKDDEASKDLGVSSVMPESPRILQEKDPGVQIKTPRRSPRTTERLASLIGVNQTLEERWDAGTESDVDVRRKARQDDEDGLGDLDDFSFEGRDKKKKR